MEMEEVDRLMRFQRYTRLITAAIVLGFLGGLLVNIHALAQINDGGFAVDGFTFFIPFPTEVLDDQFDVGFAGDNLIGANIETTISMAVHRSGTIIFFDHWEDGLEPFLTSPFQPTTQIWGDNDPTNGIPPNFSNDVLNSGDVVILRNIVELDDAGLRNPSTLFFDGGDTLTSLGGPLAVTLAAWPEGPGILYAGAWPLYPTNRWGMDFRLPVGTDLAAARPAFTVVGVNVQAVQNGTTVQLDLDADGSFEEAVILNRGEQFNSLNGISVGARVLASAPVQVHILTANPASSYEARAYTMIPFDQWSVDLIAPRSSDGDYWLYNPHDTMMEVRVQTITTTTVITLPASSTVKYPPEGLSDATGIRFTSLDGRSLYGLAALDADDAQDWGYAMLPFTRLDTQTLIGLGIGNNNTPPDNDESRVYVTAVTTTTIFADFDNDGTVDANFPVSPLAEVPITDPDHDLTGTFLFTNDETPFMAVWGQDASANPALPSIDIGITIIPLPSLLVQKTVGALVTDADCTGTITPGDTIRFRLFYFNNSFRRMTNTYIRDDLPDSLIYVRGSTRVNGDVVPDDPVGTPFPLDNTGYSLGTVEEQGSGNVVFDVVINDNTGTIINWAFVNSSNLLLGEDFAIMFVAAQEPEPVLEIGKTLLGSPDNTVYSGQVITFSLAITNVSPVTVTTLPLQDTFNPDHLTFLSANPEPDAVVPGEVLWNDVTNLFGDLSPGASIRVNASFIVNQLPENLDSLENYLTVLGAQRSDNLPPLFCQDVKILLVSTPPAASTPETPTSTSTPAPPATATSEQKTPTSTVINSGADGQNSTATPDPTGIDAFVLPVLLLPETGMPPRDDRGDVILLLGFVGACVAILWLGTARKK